MSAKDRAVDKKPHYSYAVYADELIGQTEEILERYDPDGFFYDAVLYDHDGCLCTQCLPELLHAGRDPGNREDRIAHNHAAARRFMQRIGQAIHARKPDADLAFNTRWISRRCVRWSATAPTSPRHALPPSARSPWRRTRSTSYR